MAARIRLARFGRRKAPYYRLVVADSRSPRDGRFIETLGYYHPLEKDESKQVQVDEDKALAWLHRGAQPSETSRSILRKQGILRKFHDAKVAARKAGKGGGAPAGAPAE